MRISGGKDAKDVKKMRSLMFGNLLFDGAIGLVPVFGDIADTIFKCNTRNAVLLELLLTKRARKEAAALDSSEKSAQDRHVGTSNLGTSNLTTDAHPNQSSNLTASSLPPQRHNPPPAVNKPVITSSRAARSAWKKQQVMLIKDWFNGFRRGSRGERDVEKAEGTLDSHTRADVVDR